MMMKGLKEYIEKHGKHFTVELAYDVALNKRWGKKQVEKAIQGKVWYNVTDSTIGDIVYLTNECYDNNGFRGYNKKAKCIDYALAYVGNYRYYGGILFEEWVKEISQYEFLKDNFDFTPYI